MAKTAVGATWRRNERSSRRRTLARLVVALLATIAAGALWGGFGMALLGLICLLPLATLLLFAMYEMGAGSGWEGLWTITVFRPEPDVARRVAAALANAGRPAHQAPDRRLPRWIRIAGPPKAAPLELQNGTLLWFLPETPEDPTDPPETQIVLEPPETLDPVELEFLKATVLAAMQPGYAAKEG